MGVIATIDFGPFNEFPLRLCRFASLREMLGYSIGAQSRKEAKALR